MYFPSTISVVTSDHSDRVTILSAGVHSRQKRVEPSRALPLVPPTKGFVNKRFACDFPRVVYVRVPAAGAPRRAQFAGGTRIEDNSDRRTFSRHLQWERVQRSPWPINFYPWPGLITPLIIFVRGRDAFCFQVPPFHMQFRIHCCLSASLQSEGSIIADVQRSIDTDQVEWIARI